MRNYVDGKEYFLKVTAKDSGSIGWPVEAMYNNGIGTSCGRLEDKPGLLLTAEEVASTVKDAMYAELAKQNAALTNDIGKQNRDIVNLEKTAEQLREENDRLTAWYKEANKTASEAAEANDELKAKIAELKSRNAELEALLKEVTATRDEAIKQNDDLKSELEDARHVNEYAVETARSKEKLIGEQRELMKKYSVVIDILIDKITALKRGESDG